jgi:hypothetical protein
VGHAIFSKDRRQLFETVQTPTAPKIRRPRPNLAVPIVCLLTSLVMASGLLALVVSGTLS